MINNSAADCSISLKFGTKSHCMTCHLQQMLKVKSLQVKVSVRHNDIWNLLNYHWLSQGLFDFDQMYYRLWPRNIRSTTNFQGQRVRGQGHSVTLCISLKNCYISDQIAWLSLNFVQTILNIAQHMIHVQDYKVKYPTCNNSAVDCRISVKFGTDVIWPCHSQYTTKVQGQRSKVTA